MRITCPHCGKEYQVKEAFLGRKARCSNPACKQMFVLHAPPTTASSSGKSGGAVGPGGALPVGTPPGPAPSAIAPESVPVSSPLDALLAAELGPPATPAAGGPAVPGPWAIPGAPSQAAIATPLPGPVGAPLAPPAYLSRRRRRPWVLPALIGAAASAVLALVVLVVIVVARAFQGGATVSQATGGSAAASNGLPAWAAFCPPAQAKALAYVNIDKVRQSAILGILERLAKQRSGKSFNLQAQLTPLKDAFFVGGPQASVVVLRTRDDLSLETISAVLSASDSPQGAGSPTTLSSHAGISYVRFRDGYIAKLASCTYCASDHEGELKQAIDRHRRGEAPPLDAALAEAFKNIPSGDHFLAMIPEQPTRNIGNPAVSAAMDFAKEVRWMTAAAYVDSSIRGTLAMEFHSSEHAAKVKAQFDKTQKDLAAQLSQMPPQIRKPMQMAADLLNQTHMSQSGQRLKVTIDWQGAALANLMKDLER